MTVAYATANGTATAGTDYTAASGTLTFAPGVTSQTVIVNVDGTTATGSRTFTLNLSSPSGATVSTASATGTIVDSGVTSTDISDNLSATSGGTETATGSTWVASSFTTGSTSETFSSIALLLAETTTGVATVSIYSDAGLEPGSLVGTLTSPSTYSTTLAQETFTSSSVIALSASTTYWVVLQASTGAFGWSWTSTSTGSGSGTGFTNYWAESSDSGVTWFTYDAYPTQMKVLVS